MKQQKDGESNLDAITNKVEGLLDGKTKSAAPPLAKSLFDRISSSDETKKTDNVAAAPLPSNLSTTVKVPEAPRVAPDAPLPPDPTADNEKNVIEDAPLPPEPSMTKPEDNDVALPPLPDIAPKLDAEKIDASKKEPGDAKVVEAEEDSDLLQTSYEVQVKLQDLQADPNNPLYSAKSFEQLNLYVAKFDCQLLTV